MSNQKDSHSLSSKQVSLTHNALCKIVKAKTGEERLIVTTFKTIHTTKWLNLTMK